MIARHKRNTNFGIAGGLALNLVGMSVGGFLGFLFSLAGLGTFIWGCYSYAKGKGQHGAWATLGLLSVFGLIGLAVLKDKCPNGEEEDGPQKLRAAA